VPAERTEQGLSIRTVPIVAALGSRAHRQALAPGIAAAAWSELRDADLCLLQGLWSLPVAVGSLACRLRGVPYVVQAWGTLERRSLGERAGRKRLYMRLVAGPLLRRAAAVHFVSERERDQSREALGAVPSIVAPQGFDPVEPRPRDGAGWRRELGLPDDAVLLGYAGRLHPRKALSVVLDALPHCPPNVHLLAFGPDLDRHGRVLARQAAARGLGPRYRALGFLHGDALARAYASIDLLVLPSLGESFGNVVVEALARGTEVMVSDQVALAGWVAGHRIGRVVAGHDPAAWAAAIGRWLAERGTFDRERAVACVRRDFDLDARGRELRAALDALVARAAAGEERLTS
jgi:glycosyltransferase involved in cell wall biosynthesis